MTPLVLGAGPEIHQIIGISVLVITVLGWIVNVIQGNTPDGTPRQQPQKPRTGRSKIEDLLQELTSEKRKPAAENREKREQPQQPSKPPAERIRTKSKTPPQRPTTPPPYSRTHRDETTRKPPKESNSKLPSANLGGAVRSHHLESPIDSAVKSDIGSVVKHDLGNRLDSSVQPREVQVHPLVKALSNPQGIRQAVLLNEILQRPKSVRD